MTEELGMTLFEDYRGLLIGGEPAARLIETRTEWRAGPPLGRERMKTVWLSFVGDDGFRGVVVVDVSEEEEARALALADQIFLGHRDTDGTLLAALRTTHRTGCNPGGHVECTVLAPDRLPAVARNTLFSKADLQALGLV